MNRKWLERPIKGLLLDVTGVLYERFNYISFQTLINTHFFFSNYFF
jgi:hypothetical protein